jgi:hypothetical protein
MFGTELNSAYAPFNSDNDVVSPFLQDAPMVSMDVTGAHSGIQHKSTPIMSIQNQQSGPYTQTQPQFQSPVVSAENQRAPQAINMVQQPLAPTNQDPRITVLLNELKKQQKLTANMQQQSGYLDKLFAKKKEVLRILQFSLIIVLAMSLHFVVDHYMTFYIKNNDLTFERELLLRLLYPVSLLFVLWNMKTFLK